MQVPNLPVVSNLQDLRLTGLKTIICKSIVKGEITKKERQ